MNLLRTDSTASFTADSFRVMVAKFMKTLRAQKIGITADHATITQVIQEAL